MREMHWQEKADVFCGFTLLPSVYLSIHWKGHFIECSIFSLWPEVMARANQVLFVSLSKAINVQSLC